MELGEFSLLVPSVKPRHHHPLLTPIPGGPHTGINLAETVPPNVKLGPDLVHHSAQFCQRLAGDKLGQDQGTGSMPSLLGAVICVLFLRTCFLPVLSSTGYATTGYTQPVATVGTSPVGVEESVVASTAAMWNAWAVLCHGWPLAFSLCPGKGLPLLPQQAAESVPQTTQQVLGQALVE